MFAGVCPRGSGAQTRVSLVLRTEQKRAGLEESHLRVSTPSGNAKAFQGPTACFSSLQDPLSFTLLHGGALSNNKPFITAAWGRVKSFRLHSRQATMEKGEPGGRAGHQLAGQAPARATLTSSAAGRQTEAGSGPRCQSKL